MARPLQSLRLRQVIVAALRADAELIAIGETPISAVDEAGNIRIYGRRSPAVLIWPFLRVSIADEGPLRLGTEPRVTVHTFSKAQYDDEVETLNGRVQTILEGKVMELSSAAKAYVTWISSQVIPDAAEADAWHGLNSFTATIG
jgi:hypothetical protein